MRFELNLLLCLIEVACYVRKFVGFMFTSWMLNYEFMFYVG